MGLFGSLFWVLAVVCMVWVIYDVVTKHKKWDTTKKAVWIILAIIFSVITAIVYYFMEVKKK